MTTFVLPFKISDATIDPAAASTTPQGSSTPDGTIDALGLKLTSDPNVSSNLSGTPFAGHGDLDLIASLAGASGTQVTPGSTTSITMSTGGFQHLNLSAGEVISFDYGWITSDPGTENDYAFALLQREGGSVGAMKLADQALLSTVGGTAMTGALSISITTSGYYDLAFGDVYDGSSGGSSLRVKAVTGAFTTKGANAVTVSTAGLTTGDGTLYSTAGAILLADGTQVSSQLADGAKQIIDLAAGVLSNDSAGLITQDGAGLITQDGAGLITQDGAGVVSTDGAGAVTRDVGASAGFTPQARAFSASSPPPQPAKALIYAGLNADGQYTYLPSSTAPTTVSYSPPAQTLSPPHQLGGTIAVGSGPTAGVAQGDASVASLSDGRFVVVWDDDKGASGHFEIRAQIFNSNGTASGSSFVVSTDTTHGSQETPTVVGVQGGGFAIAWRGVSDDSTHNPPDTHLQMFNSNGAKVGGEARVGLPAPFDTNNFPELNPRLGSTWDGGFVLTFEGQPTGQADSAGIAVRYDAGRNVLGYTFIGDHSDFSPASGVNVSDLTSIGLSDNSYVVAYREQNPHNSGDHDGIFIDLIESDGTAGYTKVQVNTTETGSQYAPSIARLNDNNIVVAWVDSGTSFTSGQAIVRAQVINSATGEKIGGELSLGTTLSGQSGPSVVALDNGGFSVTWTGASLKDGQIVGAHLESQIFNNAGSQESPVFPIGPVSQNSTVFDKNPVSTQVADSSGNHTIFTVGQHTGADGTTSIETFAYTNDGRTVTASTAPTGSNQVAFLSNHFDVNPPHAADREVSLNAGSFGFSDADGNNFTGVTITTMPTTGTLYDNNQAVTAGQFISVNDLKVGGRVVYKTFDTTTANFSTSFTFQVHDDGTDLTFGGSDVDPTPRTMTLKVNAAPTISNVATFDFIQPGQTGTILSPGLTVNDDSGTLSGAHVTISNQGFVSGDVLSVLGADPITGMIAGTNITATSVNFGLNLSGLDTVANYQQVLRSISYSYNGSSSAAGAGGVRTIFWDVEDGQGAQSAGVTSTNVGTVAIALVNPPSSGVLAANQSLSISVSVGSKVSITGTPYLTLSDGGKATFNKSASDLTHGKIVFTYTATPGDSATNLGVTGVVVGSGASINANGVSLGSIVFPGPGYPTSISVDAIPPLPPGSTAPDHAPILTTDTGLSQTDGITAIKTPTFSGTAEAGATVTLYDGFTTKVIGVGTADTSGNFTITTTALADGTHTIAAKAKDTAGNVSDFSIGRPITIDAVAPAKPPAPKLLPAYDSGSSSTDGITNTPNPGYSGTAEKGSTVSLYIDGQLVGTAVASVADGKYEVFSQTQFTQSATHQVSVTATDVAGNVSGSSAASVLVIDRTPPATPASPSLTPASNSGDKNDGITNDTTPTVTGTADAGSIVTLYDTNGTSVIGTVVANSKTGAYSITPKVPLGPGSHSLSVTATDAAGNTSAASSPLLLTIDQPTIVLDTASDSGSSNGDGITQDTTPTVTGSAAAGAFVTIYDGTKAIAVASADSMTGAYSVDLSTPLKDGVHKLTAKSVDNDGNISAVSSVLLVTIDTKPPVVSITNKAGSSTSTVTGKAEAGTIVTITDGTTVLGSATTNAKGVWSIPVDISNVGTQTVVATDTDVAGNVGTSKPVTLTLSAAPSHRLATEPAMSLSVSGLTHALFEGFFQQNGIVAETATLSAWHNPSPPLVGNDLLDVHHFTRR